MCSSTQIPVYLFLTWLPSHRKLLSLPIVVIGTRIHRHHKPWGVRRSLDSDDDDYNVCVNKNWNQCGGHGYTGVRCCAPGWKCQFINAWYSHCVPDTRSRCRQNSFWSQCGGYHFTGYTCCTTGSNCVKINAWYSQCVPNWYQLHNLWYKSVGMKQMLKLIMCIFPEYFGNISRIYILPILGR